MHNWLQTLASGVSSPSQAECQGFGSKPIPALARWQGLKPPEVNASGGASQERAVVSLSSLMSRKGGANDIALRDSLFPDAPRMLWAHKPSGGFVTVPKTMPYIVRILDEITKGQPVGTVYSTLWTFTWNNDAFVKMGRIREIAYACGFTGTRGIRTLNDRLVELRRLGMIETREGAEGEISYVFLPNPHYALLKLWQGKTEKIEDASFNAFKERATNVGSKDVLAMLAFIAAGNVLTAAYLAPPLPLPTPPVGAVPPAAPAHPMPVPPAGFAMPGGFTPAPPTGWSAPAAPPTPVVESNPAPATAPGSAAPPTATLSQDEANALLATLPTLPPQK